MDDDDPTCLDTNAIREVQSAIHAADVSLHCATSCAYQIDAKDHLALALDKLEEALAQLRTLQ